MIRLSRKPENVLTDTTVMSNSFSLLLPPNWEDHTVYLFKGPIQDGIEHQINVTVEHNVEINDLGQYVELQVDAMRSGLKSYHELKLGPIRLADNTPAYEIVYKWQPTDEREIYQRVIYVLSGRDAYSMVTSFSKKTWKLIGQEVDKILMSFTVPQVTQSGADND